ncbi:MAG: glutamate decarboxylase [Ruminococcaceae bacterium]|nr:glutamate decarboxylase [Oscillospiraceae bacterium]
MWTVIYMVQDQSLADNIRSTLEENRIITKVRTLKQRDQEHCCYEILVPSAEVSAAHDMILEAEFKQM